MEIRGGNNNNNRLMLPDDGYEWRKYGQKFIKNIAKFRSYFRCRKSQCKAKKRAEWLTSEPNNLRVVYDGVHSHASLTPSDFSQGTSSTTSRANPYDLLTQVLEDQSAIGISSDGMVSPSKKEIEHYKKRVF